MINISSFFNNIIPPKLYEVKKHNLIGIFFVLLVILVAQYPVDFKKSLNTVFGKLFILLIVALLTNYNIVAGLTATIVTLALYIDLFKTGNEGFVGKTTTAQANTPKADTSMAGKPTSSTPAVVGGDAKDTLVTNKFAAPAQVVKKTVPTPTKPAEKQANMVDLKLSAQQQVASKSSKAIPYTPVKNAKVEAFSGMYGGYTFTRSD
jgi:hypothetical protein